MNIHEFISENLYEYDITACHYNILKSIGYDVSNINYDDKKQRNIQIGLLQRDNPSIAMLLESKANNILDIYLKENNILNTDVLWRQKDGFIIRKPLINTNITIPIDFRGNISKLIYSMNKKKMLILYSDNTYTTKGFSNKPYDTEFYKLFSKLNYSNKKILSSNMEQLRQYIMNSNNINWFVYPIENKLLVPMKEGMIKVDRGFINSIDITDIDRKYLWDFFIWPFAQTILVYCQLKSTN